MNRGAVLKMIYECVKYKDFVKNAEWTDKAVSFDIGGYKYNVTLTRKKSRLKE